MTRLLVPTAVLLATGGLLAYAARDALQPRLEVFVAAAIPKEIFANAPPTDGAEAASDTAEKPADAVLGPVAVQAPGWIEPAPYAVSVPALAEGVVKELLVLDGERVEVGQVIARLIDDDARLALRAADATVAERDADVARTRAALATAESQVEVERTAAAELRDEVTRKRELVPAGGLSEGTFRRMEIRLGGLDAKVATAEKMVSEARAVLAQAESARAAANVLRDEAALRLERMEVRSPVAGIVLAHLVEPGSRISMSGQSGDAGPARSMMGAVIRLYDPAKLQVRVDVPLADAAKVSVGTRATVSTEALADQTFSGVVSRVVHEANIQRNTVQFKVALDAPSPVLKPEMLTRVRLHAPASASQRRSNGSIGGPFPGDSGGGDLTLLVPTAAVAAAGDGRGQVWVVDTSGGSPVARRRDIVTAPSADEGFTAVISGLRLTDRIILDPPAPPAIRDGMRLKVLGERTTTPLEPASSNP
ncbi:MAG: efflux RND transporter periplasmic adaptor subunit [Phycisphaeraceae bacterium]|nr:efflux RND transporter periplasmic adaptor subunit [Phycisphaeraceae bacterium]MBX3404424.1 efflux RND transporter periplasmic adaptor subunit [Phycisphaeraceae bacterium]MCW5775371.1 efflux RND transporter periplasmic adaptor subunit [Phycisphaeraceae bacterium]